MQIYFQHRQRSYNNNKTTGTFFVSRDYENVFSVIGKKLNKILIMSLRYNYRFEKVVCDCRSRNKILVGGKYCQI